MYVILVISIFDYYGTDILKFEAVERGIEIYENDGQESLVRERQLLRGRRRSSGDRGLTRMHGLK